MHIRSFWYGNPEGTYARLAKVLEHSCGKYHNDVSVIYREGHCQDRSHAFKRKAVDWFGAIATATQPLALLDTDTMVLASLAPAFAEPFDIAVTVHATAKGKALNSGVLFVRPSERVTQFFAQWPAATEQWCKRNSKQLIRYGDQDALIAMLRQDHGLTVRELPMAVWNSTQLCWPAGIEEARIVHVKCDARGHLFDRVPLRTHGADAVVRVWRDLEKECSQ